MLAEIVAMPGQTNWRDIPSLWEGSWSLVVTGQWLIKMLNIAAYLADDDICAIKAETETILIASHGSSSGPYMTTSGQKSS